MVLDECTTWPVERREAEKSMRLSLLWAERSQKAFRARPGYGLFGIVQGSVFDELRQEAAKALVAMGFDGYAVGGLAVGEGQAEMFRMIEATEPFLPPDRPRYLMGVGRPLDIVGAVARGMDMFDCVMPTRSGRTGQAFTRRGTLNMRNARHQDDPRPIDEACGCPVCRGYGRAYVHHLFRAGEMLGPMLLTAHNLRFYQDLMAGLRSAIEAGRFAEFAAKWAAEEASGDIKPMPESVAGGRED
jgi:queuine tRNA-ribosyltransferase